MYKTVLFEAAATLVFATPAMAESYKYSEAMTATGAEGDVADIIANLKSYP